MKKKNVFEFFPSVGDYIISKRHRKIITSMGLTDCMVLMVVDFGVADNNADNETFG